MLYTIPYYTMLYYTILHYTIVIIVFYIVLNYAILCYIILYCIMSSVCGVREYHPLELAWPKGCILPEPPGGGLLLVRESVGPSPYYTDIIHVYIYIIYLYIHMYFSALIPGLRLFDLSASPSG